MGIPVTGVSAPVSSAPRPLFISGNPSGEFSGFEAIARAVLEKRGRRF
jgi:hypothetical protein